MTADGALAAVLDPGVEVGPVDCGARVVVGAVRDDPAAVRPGDDDVVLGRRLLPDEADVVGLVEAVVVPLVGAGVGAVGPDVAGALLLAGSVVDELVLVREGVVVAGGVVDADVLDADVLVTEIGPVVEIEVAELVVAGLVVAGLVIDEREPVLDVVGGGLLLETPSAAYAAGPADDAATVTTTPMDIVAQTSAPVQIREASALPPKMFTLASRREHRQRSLSQKLGVSLQTP